MKKSEFNIQLFGPDCPPFYGEKEVSEIVDEISKIDEEINELAIRREERVKAFKEKVKEVYHR